MYDDKWHWANMLSYLSKNYSKQALKLYLAINLFIDCLLFPYKITISLLVDKRRFLVCNHFPGNELGNILSYVMNLSIWVNIKWTSNEPDCRPSGWVGERTETILNILRTLPYQLSIYARSLEIWSFPRIFCFHVDTGLRTKIVLRIICRYRIS